MAAQACADHRLALQDWLACAIAGAGEPAAGVARAAGSGLPHAAGAGVARAADAGLARAAGAGLLERTTAAGAAGHVLDFDDTYPPGLVHLSAAVAPAALVLGAQRNASIARMLNAYAAGFEAMGLLARTCHPALYDGGWHPTAVCGGAGAAVAAARLLELDVERERAAIALALLRASGLRAAFGSDGKALQVGLAAASGVQAALLAAAGANVDAEEIVAGDAGFAGAFGVDASRATLDAMADAHGAAAANWIKAYPCCLQTHAAIDAALALARVPDGEIVVAVHPLSRRAAALDAVDDGLQAKFSIPYLTAYALLHGGPDVAAFASVDRDAAALGRRIVVRTDAGIGTAEARIEVDGEIAVCVTAPRGSPANPLDVAARRAKTRALAGDALDGALDDPERPAATLLDLVRAGPLSESA